MALGSQSCWHRFGSAARQALIPPDPARAVVHDGAHDRWRVHRERATGDESTDSERELQNTAAAVFGHSNRVAQSGWHNVHRMKTNATSARK
jgi:hypothetical protein